mmetsp:Transcript_114008/g.198167  ORF Transcript_114008/g.198167 Transcript_114008/m.198167 type:complete len:219 (+) Transcript_114008:222-878(+)
MAGPHRWDRSRPAGQTRTSPSRDRSATLTGQGGGRWAARSRPAGPSTSGGRSTSRRASACAPQWPPSASSSTHGEPRWPQPLRAAACGPSLGCAVGSPAWGCRSPGGPASRRRWLPLRPGPPSPWPCRGSCAPTEPWQRRLPLCWASCEGHTAADARIDGTSSGTAPLGHTGSSTPSWRPRRAEALPPRRAEALPHLVPTDRCAVGRPLQNFLARVLS